MSLPGQTTLPFDDDPEDFEPAPEPSCVNGCRERPRHVARRGNIDFWRCPACDQEWDVLDYRRQPETPRESGPACASCQAPTRIEPGKGPHFAKIVCTRCTTWKWMPKPRSTDRGGAA